ncbi:MAG: hypothetical protein AABZ39_03160 [Spirochaetota bacterium]
MRTMILVASAMLFIAGCTSAVKLTPSEADRFCREGWNTFSRGLFSAAEKNFRTVVTGAPAGSTASIANACYGLGMVYNFGDKIDRAQAKHFYEKAAQGTNDTTAWALLALARLKEVVPMGQTPDYEGARKGYRDLGARFPGHPAAEEAFLHLMTTYLITYRIEDAKVALAEIEEYLRANPDTPYKERLYDILASAYNNISMNLGAGSTPAERMAFRTKGLAINAERLKILKEYKNYPVANDIASTLWNLGFNAAFAVGDLAKARAYLNELITSYPYDFRAPLAAIELKRFDRIAKTGRIE